MEVLHYLAILWKRRLVVGLTFLATVSVIVLGVRLLPTEYTAYALIRVSTVMTGDASWTDYNLSYTDRLTQTYISLATSGLVQRELVARLGVDQLPTLSVRSLPNTELVEISATAQDPMLAARAATAVAQFLRDKPWESGDSEVNSDNEQTLLLLAEAQTDLKALQAERQRLASENEFNSPRYLALNEEIELARSSVNGYAEQVKQQLYADMQRGNLVSIVEEAVVPVHPSGPDTRMYILLGVVIAITSGVVLALFFDSTDTRIFTTEPIEQITKLPIVGKIPHIAGVKRNKSLGDQSMEKEAFQRLYLALQSLKACRNEREQNPKAAHSSCTLLITSAAPREGKSTVAANLARTFMDAGRNVAIIDADMRKPTLHKIFGLASSPGLGEILSGELNPKNAKQRNGGLSVVTAGTMVEYPSRLLMSWRMAHLLNELEKEHDVILIDTAASLAIADAQVLVPLVDAVLMVTRRGTTRREPLETAFKQLVDAHAPLIGIVLNDAKLNEEHRQHSYYRQRRSS